MERYKINKNREQSGFTLIEFIVVILIMSIFLIYAIPKIESSTKINLEKSARKLIGAIMYTRNEAVFKKKTLRLMYDIEENSYSIKEIDLTKDGFIQEDYNDDDKEEEGALKLEDGVSFMDIVDSDDNTLTYGKAYTHFFITGMVEKTLIHLKNENDVVKALEINTLTGEVDIHDEYYNE